MAECAAPPDCSGKAGGTAGGRPRDDTGLPVTPDRILRNLLVRRVNIEHRDVAAASRDIAKRVGIGELIGQLCRALEADFLPAPYLRLLGFPDWKRRDPMFGVARLPS
jgi:hypothetical protein